jgi:hypothetical protein
MTLPRVGILTKPDRIQAGDEEPWLGFVRNEKEPLANNWYCVKQPASNALKQGITWEQARAEEDNFFNATLPWSALEPTWQRYLRTSNLTARLSILLSDLIGKRLDSFPLEALNQTYVLFEASRDSRGASAFA